MPRGSSPTRERQYEHIKDSTRRRGESTGRSKEIAARTVGKQRARSGETRNAGKASTPVSSRRRSGTGPAGRTKEQLYDEARRRDIKGRSSMNKAQLERALSR